MDSAFARYANLSPKHPLSSWRLSLAAPCVPILLSVWMVQSTLKTCFANASLTRGATGKWKALRGGELGVLMQEFSGKKRLTEVNG